MSKKVSSQVEKPDYVVALEKAYGEPSQAGFGSAIFFEQVDDKADLEELAKKYYQYFVGELWERWGEEAWMSPWKEVYNRPAKAKGEIAKELEAIEDDAAQMQVPMILGVVESAPEAGEALSAAFSADDVSELRVYNLGDGSAMSGLLIAGRHENGDAAFLTFLYD